MSRLLLIKKNESLLSKSLRKENTYCMILFKFKLRNVWKIDGRNNCWVKE